MFPHQDSLTYVGKDDDDYNDEEDDNHNDGDDDDNNVDMMIMMMMISNQVRHLDCICPTNNCHHPHHCCPLAHALVPSQDQGYDIIHHHHHQKQYVY